MLFAATTGVTVFHAVYKWNNKTAQRKPCSSARGADPLLDDAIAEPNDLCPSGENGLW
jgi:hypothetical protein